MKRDVGWKTGCYRMFLRVLSALLLLVLFIIPFDTVKAETVSSDSDFVIEDGVLIKYKGSASEVVIPEGVTVFGGGVLDHNGLNWNSKLKSVVLPDSLKEIREGAFCNSPNLTKIDIPDGVTRIGYRAFYGCENLAEINIPETVPDIFGVEAFEGTAWLKAKEEECDLVIVNGMLISGRNAKGEVKVPEGVTRIVRLAMFASLVTKIDLPESLVEIDELAFSCCGRLEEIHMKEGVVKIGAGAFEECGRLKEVLIPRSVTECNFLFPGHIKRPLLLVYKGSPYHKYAKESKAKYRVVADPEEGKSITVKVQKGDSLWKIAREHLGRGIRYEEIMKLNHLKGTMIFVGQELKVPIK